jgi:hypothetical protein
VSSEGCFIIGILYAAGIRVFVGGLHPASTATALTATPDAEVVSTDGPYLKTTEHMGGFWLLDVADLNQAVAWGHKAALACRAPVEVRQFY